jgi:hypothetical protein
MEGATPLSFEVSIAEMAHHFVIFIIKDELMRQTSCNSATQTYPMTFDLLHLWILTIENKMPARLI